mmetsp:Transcript_15197/g.30309  ORF Transcript_15197/g.30309 Transcript_15197/m.30309 type:complete len:113 (-) Transcript_15197:1362-1700(-)
MVSPVATITYFKLLKLLGTKNLGERTRFQYEIIKDRAESADDIMRLLRERRLISPAEYASYLEYSMNLSRMFSFSVNDCRAGQRSPNTKKFRGISQSLISCYSPGTAWRSLR